MEIEKKLSYNSRSTAEYVSLSTYKGCTTFKILKEPYYISPNDRWNDTISLKDVEYNIVDGVLFVKGTRIFHHTLGRILGDLITKRNKRSIWKVNDNINNQLVEPFVKEDIVIRKFFFFRKTIKAFDLNRMLSKDVVLLDEIKTHYLCKFQPQYEVALSNFELIESL